ncbi:hypothetical protein IPJ91_03030 [bacterium]|nr:MAG: hypothetical protein IPJ91_03030 [bacterium]
MDETSIGYNAYLISQNLFDEHGKHLPLYFEAFGEYKNPIYIYTTALLFKFTSGLGYIELLRLTSFLFWLIFFIGSYKVIQVFSHSKFVLILGLLVTAFSPFIFQISRISFEVISMASFMIWFYYFILRYDNLGKIKFLIFAASILGISYYSYSTARLFVILAFLILFLYLLKKRATKSHLILLVVIGAGLIVPAMTFSYVNDNALTRRFDSLTYINNPKLNLLEKSGKFLLNYFVNFDLSYLLIIGDRNSRHSTIYFGEIYVVMFVAVLLYFKHTKTLISKPINAVLVGLFIVSPISTALTNDTYHSLRGFIIFLTSLPFVFSGLEYIKDRKTIYALLIFTIIQIIGYLTYYFAPSGYQYQSRNATENYGFQPIINKLFEKEPQQIYLVNDYPDINRKFYEIVLDEKIEKVNPSTTFPTDSEICVISNKSFSHDKDFTYIETVSNSDYRLWCNF